MAGLRDKVAIVTGGCHGINEAVALPLAAQRTLEEGGRIDILHNGAAVVGFATAHELEESEGATVLDTSVKGYRLRAKAVNPQMLKQGRGTMVHIASVAPTHGTAGSRITRLQGRGDRAHAPARGRVPARDPRQLHLPRDHEHSSRADGDRGGHNFVVGGGQTVEP